MADENRILTRENQGRIEVFDIARKRYVAYTQEEVVRQNVIHFLHFQLGYPLELMQVEGAISLNGMPRRCDIVVYRKMQDSLSPAMIVECKKATVPINQKVIDQACRYNLVLHVPYLFLTNGTTNLCLHVDYQHQKITQIPLPTWQSLNQS